MKKIIFVLLMIGILSGCRSENRAPETNSQANPTTKSSVFNSTESAKEYRMVLKEFDIDSITSILNPNGEVNSEQGLEYGTRYIYSNGADAAVADGSLFFYASRAKYESYYLLSGGFDYSDPEPEGLRLCEQLFENLGISGMVCSGMHRASIDEMIQVINEGDPMLEEKDGKEIDLRRELQDVQIFRFSKSIDGLEILSNQVLLENDRAMIEADAVILLDSEGVSIVRMQFIPERIERSSEIAILTQEDARSKYLENYHKAIQSTEPDIQRIELKLRSEIMELHKLLTTNLFDYVPVYVITTKQTVTKGEVEEEELKIQLLDAQTGELWQ